jgi:hypothetical protein
LLEVLAREGELVPRHASSLPRSGERVPLRGARGASGASQAWGKISHALISS